MFRTVGSADDMLAALRAAGIDAWSSKKCCACRRFACTPCLALPTARLSVHDRRAVSGSLGHAAAVRPGLDPRRPHRRRVRHARRTARRRGRLRPPRPRLPALTGVRPQSRATKCAHPCLLGSDPNHVQQSAHTPVYWGQTPGAKGQQWGQTPGGRLPQPRGGVLRLLQRRRPHPWCSVVASRASSWRSSRCWAADLPGSRRRRRPVLSLTPTSRGSSARSRGGSRSAASSSVPIPTRCRGSSSSTPPASGI